MMHIPSSTYRIQFNHLFTFTDALKILPYLQELGISDLYASPVFKAAAGSMHGYDVVDPNVLNPELGSEEDFFELASAVRERGMFWLQDIVPNHMAYSSENRMLMDLLENGESSRFNGFFDVEWNHPHASIRGRVLAPFLGDFYWNAVQSGTIRLRYDEDGFSIEFYENRYPLRIESYETVLSYRYEKLKNWLGRNHPDVIKYLGILYAIKSLPPTLAGEERSEQVRFIKEILWELYSQNQEVKNFVDETVKIYNAERELTESHDLLDALLSEQHYLIAYWKVANEEINYRRFFNISELIAVRMENEEAFNRMHSLLVKLVKEDLVHGLRIDHVDGLYDPEEYLTRLRERTKIYIVVEKILEATEHLPEAWPVEGTSGYDFTYKVNGIFCRKENRDRFDRIYTSFTRFSADFEELVCEKKNLMITTRMAGEVERLAYQVEEISSRDRYGIDITMHGLKQALDEILTRFPIYRTYINGEALSLRDRKILETTLEDAKQANPRLMNELSYIGNILLLKIRDQITPELKDTVTDFVMRFQQLTGPVMAKGVEDTALYIYNRLISLNEVGGNPGYFGLDPEEFHEFNRYRQRKWPGSLNTTYTHDTKRGEDVRARINVLSEIPAEWEDFLQRMSEEAEPLKKRKGRRSIPDRNDEYFLYQTILGSRPFTEDEMPAYLNRLKGVIVKGVREAAVHTAWIKPDEEYENGYLEFIEKLLNPDNRNIRGIMDPLFRKVSWYGMFNSLSQLLLKATSPGVPDFYQGSELWDFSLVDPDNRRPVDFDMRNRYLMEMKTVDERDLPAWIASLYGKLQDGRIKLFLTWRLLRARQLFPDIFEKGSYQSTAAAGEREEHLISFTREHEGQILAAAAPRFPVRLSGPGEVPTGPVWEHTTLRLPDNVKEWLNLITGETLKGTGQLPLEQVFASFPGALLIGERTS